MIRSGLIISHYPHLLKNADLSELIGVILGDGHIQRFPRTERLLIVGNSNNPKFIEHYADLVEKVFHKKPHSAKVHGENAIRISLYQKRISERLGIPLGSRKGLQFRTPSWISKNRGFLVKFLRGLFEAEGSLSIHRPTYTYNLQFSNRNQSLLNAVKDGLTILGFNPETRPDSVRLRKKAEVENFLKISRFRMY